ncbi:hypothetical protein T4E_2155 [Trichinella pseudospiralis]|uniref:Uncharacterized protein n=1 Tax=Trichinella pseudospiralis TaxID=6337 RepID=A0A0V0XJ52_TRIPS|nr:hypothetical protein T4E_2155 [Trichinella pseudospiralis]
MNNQEEKLKLIWFELTDFADSSVKIKWWERICNAYNHPLRQYHSLKRIWQLFKYYDQCRHLLSNAKAVAFAIFFHNICYDPNSNSNEQESAMANIVLDMIVHKNLQKADSPLTFKTEDAYYFYDIELAILGSNSSDYADYKSQTRQEYSRMSDEAYRTKRLSVLKTFLQIPNIFRTKLFSEEFEQNARRNICGEVEELSTQQASNASAKFDWRVLRLLHRCFFLHSAQILR